MKEQIIKISEALKRGEMTTEQARSFLIDVLNVSDNWIRVTDQTPPSEAEILAKSPDGTIQLTTWRPDYEIFSCQGKGENTFWWKWKMT